MTTQPLTDGTDRHTALTDFDTNLVVVAGAGTGKTSLLVGRLAYALVRMHMDPSSVLALTFTDNAAAEMRARLVRLLRAAEPWLDGQDIAEPSDRHTLDALGFASEDRSRIREVLAQADSLPLSTFHSFCSRLLTQHARLLGLPPEQSSSDQEGSRARYDAAFLAYLARQPEDDVPQALRRFEPKALHDFGWELRSLPIDSIARCTEVPEPELADAELRSAIEEVAGFAKHPDLIKLYADCLPAIEVALAAMLDRDFDRVPQDLPEKLTRNPWTKRSDNETRDRIRARTNALLEQVRPYAKADPAGIRCAIDFVLPFLEEFQADSMQRGELTYDDIILQARWHLMQSGPLRRTAGGTLRTVLVDEFQDTDPLLYDILFLLCGEAVDGRVETPLDLPLRPATLFVVGDPKQSIYRFRSADLAAFDLATKRVLDAVGGTGRRLSLRTNFRCATPIVEFVNRTCSSLLEEQLPYQLEYESIHAHVRHDSATVEWLTVDGTEDLNADDRRALEGRATVQAIQRLRRQGVRYAEIAVLLRAATETNWLMRPLRESGIPYAMEGSRRFYQRHEVIVATALLGAIARPQDPVPVLGILRSAFSAATDREIFEHVQTHGRHSLDYRRELAGTADTEVGRTLGWLRDLRHAVRTLPIDRAVEHLMTLDGWTLTEGAGYEGAQRLANIERMLHRVLDARPLDLGAAADFVEQRTAREIEDEESPLFDPDFDAVRILTIHASKGLEYVAVIVPDLARNVTTAERDANEAKVQRAFLGDGSELVGARLSGLRNTASWMLRKENKEHASAEAKRLFYVATTRAKRHLLLLCSAAKQRMQQSLQRKVEETLPFPESTTVRTVEVTSPTRDEGPGGGDIVGETLAAWRAHEQTVARLTSTTVVPSVAKDLARTPSARNSNYDPTELGTAIHRYLAIVDLARTDLDSTLADQIVEDPAYRADFLVMAERFHSSELATRLQTAESVHRELPIAFVDTDGVPQSRVIDLLLIEREDPTSATLRHTIVDHKSDHVPPGEHPAAAESYAEQLDRYASGVERALGLTSRPDCLIHFLRDATLVSVRLD